MNLQIFKNPEFGEIRTVTINNEPYFVGKDVCTIFGDTNHNRTLNRVDEEDKTIASITDSMGRKQNATVINESGLYSVLFAMQPQKANKKDGVSDAYLIEERQTKLKAFKRWVTSEVLPQIRKTGGYIPVSQQDDDATIMAKAYLIATKTLQQKEELIAAQQQQLQAQQPLVDFANHISSSKDLIDISEMAKLLSDNGITIGRNRLFTLLREQKILMSNAHHNEPYQEYIDRGYFKTKEVTVGIGAGQHLKIKTYVTGKGQNFIYNFIKQVAA